MKKAVLTSINFHLTTLIILFNVIIMLSCDKKVDDDDPNFFNNDYRIGQWITPDKRDTLEFIDNRSLIRKGDFYVHEEYLYRIEGEYLYIRLPSSSDETNHKIMAVDHNKVTLFNMYITIGFGDNSGTFFKNNK